MTSPANTLVLPFPGLEQEDGTHLCATLESKLPGSSLVYDSEAGTLEIINAEPISAYEHLDHLSISTQKPKGVHDKPVQSDQLRGLRANASAFWIELRSRRILDTSYCITMINP